MTTEGYAAGMPLLQKALAAFRDGGFSAEGDLGWLPLACRMAHAAWEFDTWSALSARLAARRISELAQATGTDWACGTAAGVAAQLSAGREADALYRETVDRLDRSGMRIEAAPFRLLYGEWLRRGDRRVDAREQLGLAHAMLSGIGAGAFTERARREFEATGATVDKPDVLICASRGVHPAGGVDRPSCRRRADQSRDRGTAVHQPSYRRVAPADGVHQARHRVPPADLPPAGRRGDPLKRTSPASCGPPGSPGLHFPGMHSEACDGCGHDLNRARVSRNPARP